MCSTTDSRGAVTNLSYDEYNQLRISSVGTHPGITYIYDSIGRLNSLTDQKGAVTKFSYDNRGLQLTRTDPLGKVSSYSYDDAGRMIKLVNFNATVTTYDYDDVNRLIRLNNQDSKGNIISDYSFELDANGNRTQVIEDEPITPQYFVKI